MKQRGIVTFVFDDGYEKTLQAVVPMLAKNNMPAVFAPPLQGEELQNKSGQKLRHWQEMLVLKEQGHELAAHSADHKDLRTLSQEDLESELRLPSEALQATTIIYPGGAVDERVATAASAYYTAGRGLVRGLESLPPRNPMQLRSFDFTRHNFSVAKANLLALWAYLTNSWLIETYHLVDEEEETLRHTVKPSAFDRHLTFVAQLPVVVTTIQGAMKSYERT